MDLAVLVSAKLVSIRWVLQACPAALSVFDRPQPSTTDSIMLSLVERTVWQRQVVVTRCLYRIFHLPSCMKGKRCSRAAEVARRSLQHIGQRNLAGSRPSGVSDPRSDVRPGRCSCSSWPAGRNGQASALRATQSTEATVWFTVQSQAQQRQEHSACVPVRGT